MDRRASRGRRAISRTPRNRRAGRRTYRSRSDRGLLRRSPTPRRDAEPAVLPGHSGPRALLARGAGRALHRLPIRLTARWWDAARTCLSSLLHILAEEAVELGIGNGAGQTVEFAVCGD